MRSWCWSRLRLPYGRRSHVFVAPSGSAPHRPRLPLDRPSTAASAASREEQDGGEGSSRRCRPPRRAAAEGEGRRWRELAAEVGPEVAGGVVERADGRGVAWGCRLKRGCRRRERRAWLAAVVWRPADGRRAGPVAAAWRQEDGAASGAASRSAEAGGRSRNEVEGCGGGPEAAGGELAEEERNGGEENVLNG
ncbi:hypothetical protein PVAP13_7NG325424 [Panicum virgatum]|uniref:Uncharacterized protein n=1 Tax=Panicum virgatum TaxID=38727 RepID=A0A8T0Q205_PANVG|nr:hypothetical protein PVAP13_7NG325424 [Panicum virgatum]